MKTMTCKQLGGACDELFSAETFEEMEDRAKKHGMEMFMKGDKEHIEAINKIREMMAEPEKMASWLKKKKEEFDALPEG